MIFGIAYDTLISGFIITACNGFWLWYLTWEVECYRDAVKLGEMRQRCIELGHDPDEHYMHVRRKRWYEKKVRCPKSLH